jgi:transcriptional regulator of acetoin/glycerol metabolism
MVTKRMNTTAAASKRAAATATVEPVVPPPREPDLVDRVFDRLCARSEAVKLALRNHPELRLAALADDNLLELIVHYVVAEFDALRPAVRAEFAGEGGYIGKRSPEERARLQADVLTLFNGRNATEVARRLGISRPTVYRYLKQPWRG